MAGSNKIKGITIEIGSDTVGLEKALSDVNKQSTKLQTELKDVERLLKFNPGNAELLAQKQKLLADQIQTTTQKLNQLKEAQSQVDQQFAQGKISEEQYRAFNRELVATQSVLDGLKGKLSFVNQEQDNIAKSTRQLNTLFEATGTSVDNFSSALGGRLTNAIKNGTASSRQLEDAINKVGVTALGTNADLDKMKRSLSKVDDGGSLKSVRKELSQVAKEAENAEDKVNGFGAELSGVVGALAAGGGIAATIEKALDTSSLKTKVDITFEVPEESKESVREAIRYIEAYGVDGEAALEGVRRQWTLNKTASDTANSTIAKGAAVISEAYAGIDFIELIQEINEISGELKITNDDAIGLVNSLLKLGFPPEQLDTIAEYGQQLQRAGYDAQEIQAIMAAGVDTKTWNIDNLLDGLKEGRIKMAEFGAGTDKATRQIIVGAGLSIEKFEEWGTAIAKGGKEGSQAMVEATKALNGVKDATARNELGVKMFGTMFEDQGQNIINTILNAQNATVDLKANQDQLNDAISKMNADPAIQLKQAFADLKTAAEPFLLKVAELVSKIAEWVKENPTLAATIAAVGTALGVLMGIFIALGPILTGLSIAAGALSLSLGAMIGIAAGIVAGIAALIAAGIAIYKNWDEIKAKAIEVWGVIKDFLSSTWEGIKSTAESVWTGIKDFFSGIWEGITTAATSIWDGVTSVWTSTVETLKSIFTPIVDFFTSTWDSVSSAFSNAWNNIKRVLETSWNAIKTMAQSSWEIIKNVILGPVLLLIDLLKGDFDGFKSHLSQIWNNIKTAASTAWNAIKTAISTIIKAFVDGAKSIFEGFKTAISTIWNAMKTTASTVWNGIKSAISSIVNAIKTTVVSVWNAIKTAISTIINGIKSTATSIWNGIKSSITSIVNGMKTAITNVWENIKSATKTAFDQVVKFIKDPLKAVDLFSIGKDIIQGLLNGIGSLAKSVWDKAKDIANGIGDSIKKALGIHSPSRVTTKLGEHTGEGFAKGISNKQKEAEKAAKKNAQAAAKNFKEALDKENYRFKMGEVDAQAHIKSLEKIRAQYAKTPEQVRKINLEIEKIRQDSVKKQAELLKQQFEQSKSYIEKKKQMNELSLADELAAWERVQARYKVGSKEREEAEQNVFRVKKEIHDKLTSLNEEYVTKVQEINQKLIDEENALNAEYQKAVEDRTKSLYSFAGIFDEVSQKADVTGDKLLKNLEDQVSIFSEWATNIQQLAEKGIDKGLLAELREMGPKAAAEVSALNSMTDSQLQDFVRLWKVKNELARLQATSELEGLKTDTKKKIDELHKNANSQLEQLKTDWTKKVKDIRSGTTAEFNAMKSSMNSIGQNTIKGLMNGLSSMTGPLLQQAREIANSISSTISKALDIHSPSRVMMRLGEYTGQGLAEGMKNSIRGITYQANELARAAVPSVPGSDVLNGSVPGSQLPAIEQNFNFYQPNPSPYDVSRKTKQAMVQWGMEFNLGR
ncbi:hypothetical protein [Heyndrickxia sp. FSL W8-0496]|uniref:hypothetical protein n=1 Tax=Heyndrickxia TaxID=2837504 RepID=UPI0030F90E79